STVGWGGRRWPRCLQGRDLRRSQGGPGPLRLRPHQPDLLLPVGPPCLVLAGPCEELQGFAGQLEPAVIVPVTLAVEDERPERPAPGRGQIDRDQLAELGERDPPARGQAVGEAVPDLADEVSGRGVPGGRGDLAGGPRCPTSRTRSVV